MNIMMNQKDTRYMTNQKNIKTQKNMRTQKDIIL